MRLQRKPKPKGSAFGHHHASARRGVCLAACHKSILRATLLSLLLYPLGATAAVSSRIATNGKIASEPDELHVLNNVRDGAPTIVIQGARGDDVYSEARLQGSAGRLAINSHACSGPPAGFAGSARVNTSIDYQEIFVITSDTLPANTPVTINIAVSAARSFMAGLNPSTIEPYLSDAANVAGRAVLRFDSSGNSTSFNGTFHESQSWINPIGRSSTGIFAAPTTVNPEDLGDRTADASTATIQALVGASFNITLQSNVSAGSSAGNPNEADGDGQLSVLWGADIAGGLAEIRSPGDNVLFPSVSNATEDRALQTLPPSPYPEPTGLGLIACFALAMRRSMDGL